MNWIKNALFSGLTEDEIREIVSRSTSVDVAAGEWLFLHGDDASELFILESGLLEVVRIDPLTKAEAILQTLQPGAVIGEMALIDRGPRSASVRAAAPSRLLSTPFSTFRQTPGSASDQPELKQTYVKLVHNLAEVMSKRLRELGDESLRQAVDRVNMGSFILSTISLLAIYIILLNLISKYSGVVSDTTFISIPLLGIFGATTLLFVKRTGLPLATFGLTRNPWPAVIEGLALSIPLCLLLIVGKWVWMQSTPGQETEPLFGWRSVYEQYGFWPEIAFACVYAAFTFVQEFIARSGLQAPLDRFLVSKHRTLISILISNLLFALTHLHVSAKLAVIVFFAGCFWGTLFKRHGNLYGAFVNHLIVGTFVFFVLVL
jgi:hypothetical protein